MTPSFQTAYNVNGTPFKVLAALCGITEQTLWKWRTCRMKCPVHKRQRVDRALDAKVDWEQYDIEFAALNSPEPSPAPEIKPTEPPSDYFAPEPTEHPEPPTPPKKQAHSDYLKELGY